MKITPIFGFGTPLASTNSTPTMDMFGGTADEERQLNNTLRANACVQFLNGERDDPALSAAETNELMGCAPYERRAFGLAN